MMWLLVGAACVAVLQALPTNETVQIKKSAYIDNGYGHQNGDEIRAEPLHSMCVQGRQLVQLGRCSAHFADCGRDGRGPVVLRTCPFQGHVFADGVCIPSGSSRDCRDGQMNAIKEETQMMAEQLNFCSRGAVVFRSVVEGCSSQALVCHHNGRDAIAVGCAQGEFIRRDMSCARTSQPCYGLASTAPIRQHLLELMCSGEGGGVNPIPINTRKSASTSPAATYSYEQPQGVACIEWYVSCQPRPSVVRCSIGDIFDVSAGRCRKWTSSDYCVLGSPCRGREYSSISLGNCLPTFLYCDGSVGKVYSCAAGTVFGGTQCVRPELAGCPVCTIGQKRRTDKCDEYYSCEQTKKGVEWVLRRCKPGQGWNERTGKCHNDYRCARPKDHQTSTKHDSSSGEPSKCEPGNFIILSCDRYMYCTGERYEEFQCRPGTAFDPKTSQCVFDPKCPPDTRSYRSTDCSSGEPSKDCKTYEACENGKPVQRPCKNSAGWMEVGCSHCESQTEVYGVDHLNFPGQCREGDKAAHPEDCAAFYRCTNGQWTYERCRDGGQFDAQKKRCVQATYGGCGSANERRCTEGERLVNQDGSRCDRLTECQNGQWVELQCPQGTIYDPTTSGCVPGSCSSDPSSPSRLPPSEPPSMPPPPPGMGQQVDENSVSESCSGNMRIPDQFDCTRLWECNSQNRFIAMACPTGSSFDPQSSNCIEGRPCDNGNGGCREGTFQPLENCGEYRVCYQGRFINARCDRNKVFINGRCGEQECGQAPGYQPECRSGSVQPHPSSPSSYMVCYYGRWTERTCPQDMVFDWKTLTCIKKYDDYHPQRPNCYSGETRPIKAECQLYEVCEYGEWARRSCPYGQHFINGYCVDGDCNSGGRCRESGGVDGYRRVQHDCTKYYQCVHGAWMERPCAPGTVFNDRIAVCDHAANVPQCGGY